jgi:hypothetical protein
VRPQWVQQLLPQLQAAHAGFAAMPLQQRMQLLLEQLLVCDFRQAGAGGLLPDNLQVRV